MKPTIHPPINKPCHFGIWHFDPADGQLTSQSKQQRLPPRLSRLLAVLLANYGQMLTRQYLIDYLWEKKSVNEDALSRAIAELRAALGDSSSAPVYVQTLPKKGYRFIHPLGSSSVLNKLPLKIVLSVIILLSASYLLFSDPSTNFEENTDNIKNALLTAERVTTTNEFEHQPELSPEGDKIAYSELSNGKLRIKIVSIDNRLQQVIKNDDAHLYSPTFSADGQSILVAAVDGNKCTVELYQLATLAKSKLATCAQPDISGIFDWSTDGNRLLYVAPQKISSNNANRPNSAIWEYNLMTKQSTQLTNPDSPDTYDTRPRYSTDNTKISMTRGSHSIRNIFLVESSTTYRAHSLTQTQAYITSFDWLNNNQLVFDSNQSGHRNLWLLDIKQKQQYLLGARDALFPSFSQNQSILTFQAASYNANIWSVNSPDKPARKLIESVKYNNFPAFSPDGDHIAFVSNRQGRSAIWLYSQGSKKQAQLMALSSADLFIPDWSKDGEKLLISSRGENGYRCYQVSSQTGQYKLLTPEYQFYGCRYSNNGEIFALSKAESKSGYLFKLDPDGNNQQVTDFSISKIQFSKSNKVLFSMTHSQGLYSMDLDGQNKQIVLSGVEHDFSDHWTVRDNELYYPRSNGEKGIWRKNLLTLKQQKITNELPTAIGETIAVSPNHKTILISKTDSKKADIYLTRIKNN